MAFTAAEKQKLAKIFGTTPTLISAHITSLGATVTADLETDVRAELVRWDAVATNFVEIEPKESNFGARIGPNKDKDDIRRNLASLLEWPYMVTAVGMGTLRIG